MEAIKSIQHRTEKELPKEVQDFFNGILSEHIQQLEKNQFIDQINIGVSMHRKLATIETCSMNFLHDSNKGLEQYI